MARRSSRGPTVADKARQVKPYVNFKINLTAAKQGKLTPAQKAKISRYHKVLFGYRYKDKDGEDRFESGLATGLRYPVPLADLDKQDREDALNLSGQTHLKELKHVFLDTVQGKSGKLLKPRIHRNRKGQLLYRVNNVDFGFAPFDPRALAKDSEREIDRVLSLYPDNKAFLIKCGKSDSRNQESRSTVKAKIIRWMGEYRNWRLWLKGVVPIEFKNQKDFRSYRKNRDDTLKSRGKLPTKNKGRRKRNG